MWCKPNQSSSCPKKCWGCDRHVEGLGDETQRKHREFGQCMEKEMEQGMKMKEVVGALEQKRGKRCKGRNKCAW